MKLAMDHFRKIIFSCACVITTFASAWAQGPTVTIPIILESPGRDFELDIQVTDLTGLEVFSMDFTLQFNGSLLDARDVISSGTISSIWGTPTVNISANQVGVAFAGVDPLVGCGSLIRIRFHVSESTEIGSSSTLNFTHFQLNEGEPSANIIEGSFTVKADDIPPVLEANPSIIERNYHDVKILIRTDEPSTIRLNYGETTSYGQTTESDQPSKAHTLNLTNLRETTTYHYRAELTDSLDNGPRITQDFSFSTKEVFILIPEITVDPGANIQVAVSVPDLSDLHITSLQFEISFNPALLNITGVSTENTLLSGWSVPNINISSGSVAVNASHNNSLFGSGILINLRAEVPANAPLDETSVLTFINASMNLGQIRLVLKSGTVTIKDRLAPLIISGPVIENLRPNLALVNWNTNEPAKSIVEYGIELPYSAQIRKESFTSSHSIELAHLQPGTEYNYRVGAIDPSDNGPTWSSNQIFTTPTAEILVSLPDSSIRSGDTLWMPLNVSDLSGFNITDWITLIGFDPELFKFLGIQQSETLTSTWPGIAVESYPGIVSFAAEANGNTAINSGGRLVFIGFMANSVIQQNKMSAISIAHFEFDDGFPYVFTSDAKIMSIAPMDNEPPNILFGPFVDNITNQSARISFGLDELSTAVLEYGLTGSYGLVLEETSLSINHEFTLIGLQSGTEIHFRIQLYDVAGNQSSFTSDSSFTTLVGNSVAVQIPIVPSTPGATIDIPIQVGDLTGLEVFSADVELHYDENLLIATEVLGSGTLSSTWGVPVFSLFPSRVVIAMGGTQALSGSGDLVKIRFILSNEVQAGEIIRILIGSFVFNDGTPQASVKSGGMEIIDNTPPETISGPFAVNIKPNSAIVTWQTDEPAKSKLYYGITSTDENVMINNELRLSQAFVITGLIPGTTYKYKISSQDNSGNGSVSSQMYEFTTSEITTVNFLLTNHQADRNTSFSIPLDFRGSTGRVVRDIEFELVFDPKILEFQDFSTQTSSVPDWSFSSAVISEGRYHFILYGDQPIPADGELIRFNFQTLNVAYGATSQLKLENVKVNDDTTGVLVQIGQFTVLDQTPPEFTTQPVVSQIRDRSVRIEWQTDEPVNSEIIFGTLGGDSTTIVIPTPSVNFSYDLTNLNPITVYEIQININDLAGNGPVFSEKKQFTTTTGNELDVVISDTVAIIGETIDIPIRISTPGSTPIQSYRFKLIFRSEKVAFQSIKQVGSLTEGLASPVVHLDLDTLELEHNLGQEIAQGGILIFIQFKLGEHFSHNDFSNLQFLEFVFNEGVPPAAFSNGRILGLDRTAPVFISFPDTTNTRSKSVSLKFVTDEPSRIVANYGETDLLGDTFENFTFLMDHEITISGLQPNKNYFYQVELFDSLDNGPTVDQIRSFQTLSAIVYADIIDTIAAINSDFKIPIGVSDISDFGFLNYQVEIIYDGSVLVPIGIDLEESLSEDMGIGNFSSVENQINYSFSGSDSLKGSGPLLFVRFHISSDASLGDSSEVIISNLIFGDGSIPVQISNGFVHFSPEVVIPEVQVSLPNLTVNPGEEFEAALIVSSTMGLDIRSFSFTLGFDQNLLDFVTVSKTGSLIQTWTDPVISLTRDSISVESSNSIPLSDEGVLLKIRFAVKADATTGTSSVLDIGRFIFNQGSPQAIITDGKVTIVEVTQGFISGTITDPRDEFIAQALVTVQDSLGNLLGSGNSNSSGEYYFGNLDRRFPYRMNISKFGFIDQTIENIHVDTTLNIILNWAFGKIFGTVVDENDEPLNGVKISVKNSSTGHVVFEINTGSPGTFTVDSLVSSRYLITPKKLGFTSNPRKVEVDLSPFEEKELRFEMRTFSLASVKITGDATISNSELSTFFYTALSTNNESVDLENPEWFLFPIQAGVVDNIGRVTPDNQYLGSAQLILNEAGTDIGDTLALSIFATVLPGRPLFVRDSRGVELIIPRQSVEQPADVRLDYIVNQSIKKSTRDKEVVGIGYDFKPDGLRFLNPATIRLPVTDNLLHQDPEIGQWNLDNAEWDLLESSIIDNQNQVEANIDHFSLFAILISSQPLGIQNVTFTPNPFSPEVDTDRDGLPGVSISFEVTSTRIRQPFVTIKIYSLHGELVRELEKNVSIDKGEPFLSQWDGRTDLNLIARNGRYLVKIEAKDGGGAETFLGQVILVK